MLFVKNISFFLQIEEIENRSSIEVSVDKLNQLSSKCFLSTFF